MDKKRKAKIENLLDELYTNHYYLYIRLQSHCDRHAFSVFTYLDSILFISESEDKDPIAMIQKCFSDY